MFRNLAAIALTLFSGTALAGTTFNFSPAKDGSYYCPTYCMGFVTDNPKYTVPWVNIYQGWPLFSVNGVTYRSTKIGDGTFVNTDGTCATFKAPCKLSAVITYYYTYTRVNSGRAHYTIAHLHVTGGTIKIPG
jgi:hypothetical protein